MIKKQYSVFLMLSVLLLGAWTMGGCSDSSSPQSTPSNLSFTTKLGQSTITPTGTTGKFEPESHGARVDSLKVTYVGMIVSSLKMHMIGGIDDDDTGSSKSGHDVTSHD